MKVKISILFCFIFCLSMGFLYWNHAVRKVEIENILQRSDLSSTSVSYSWKGGHSIGKLKFDVHAFFSGNGDASLQVGDRSPVNIKLGEDQYKQIIKSLYDNNFNDIRVLRRWGTYLWDIGEYKIGLKDGTHKRVIYVDSKHYVDKPEQLGAIFETIYAFDDQFGQRFDYGPLGTAGCRDNSEIIFGVFLLVIILVLAYVVYLIRKPNVRSLICHQIKLYNNLIKSRYLWATMSSILIAFVVSPIVSPPINETSKLDFLNLGILVLAAYLSWRAFTLNRKSIRIRLFIQLPVTSLITFMALLSAWVIYVKRWWYDF